MDDRVRQHKIHRKTPRMISGWNCVCTYNKGIWKEFPDVRRTYKMLLYSFQRVEIFSINLCGQTDFLCVMLSLLLVAAIYFSWFNLLMKKYFHCRLKLWFYYVVDTFRVMTIGTTIKKSLLLVLVVVISSDCLTFCFVNFAKWLYLVDLQQWFDVRFNRRNILPFKEVYETLIDQTNKFLLFIAFVSYFNSFRALLCARQERWNAKMFWRKIGNLYNNAIEYRWWRKPSKMSMFVFHLKEDEKKPHWVTNIFAKVLAFLIYEFDWRKIIQRIRAQKVYFAPPQKWKFDFTYLKDKKENKRKRGKTNAYDWFWVGKNGWGSVCCTQVQWMKFLENLTVAAWVFWILCGGKKRNPFGG